MKKYSVVKIVIWTIVAILLTAVLIFNLIDGNMFNLLRDKISFGPISFFSYKYDDLDEYSIGSSSVSCRDIKELEVNWVSGSVTIKPYDGEMIMFSENNAISEDDKLRYLVKDGKLTIKYCKSNRVLGFVSKNSSKDIEILIPEIYANKIDKIYIDSVSSEVKTEGISVKKFKIDNVSGKIRINKTEAEAIDISTISGACEVEGKFNDVVLESVSGNMHIQSSVCPEKVSGDSISGDINLTIPPDSGFTAESDTVSGSFNCDFAVTTKGDTRISADGSSEFIFETVSGNIYINKE